jgi:hypothetical protein
MTVKKPFALLTVKRISELAGKPVSKIQQILDEHPGIQPTATADHSPVYDRDAFLSILSLIDQSDAKQGGHSDE